MEALKEALLTMPHIKKVYMNSLGVWHINPKYGFDIVKTRSEILGTQEDEELELEILREKEAKEKSDQEAAFLLEQQELERRKVESENVQNNSTELDSSEFEENQESIDVVESTGKKGDKPKK